ncbi:MAG: DUF2357 domain-containing protein [Clostridiales bacterium]|nr:DUF2357 domain-containing protein [Clostridiales bacterium]
MSNLDTLYRAFADFRKTTSDDHDCALQRRLVAGTDSNNDFVETVRYTCHIEEDWIQAIEEGMVHVEKAIAEERQFIRNNGEVVPIEKVKRVSRDSVEHLAKHSDLITKEPLDGEPVIPDQLYTVERLSDYAVYENRFLYMLLKYLEQFISLRYNSIVELANTYRGKLYIDKSVKTGGQNVKFKVELNEERRNDPLLAELNPNKSIIERISMLYKMVTHYLSVPLMLEVAKAPMLRPPITVTNVLRMNHNFRGAMKLYEFVSSYDKPGYSAEKQIKKLNPFPDIPADEFAEVEALASYLAYQYGMGVKDILRETYLKEEERRRLEEEKKKLKKLAALKKKIEQSGGVEEYMLLLESRNRALEADSVHLTAARAEIDKLKEEINRLDTQIAQLTLLADDRASEITALHNKHEYDISQLKAEHEEELQSTKAVFADELKEQELQHLEHVERINSEHAEQVKELADSHHAELTAKDEIISQKDDIIRQKDDDRDKLCALHAEDTKRIRSECDAIVAAQQRLVDEKEKKLTDVVEENKLLAELKTLADARLTAVKYKHGYMTPADDYTSELAFNEIERQYNIFSDFFKRTWRKTKKKIRSDLASKLLAGNKQTERQTQSETEERKIADAQSTATAAEQQSPTEERKDAEAKVEPIIVPTDDGHTLKPIDFLPETPIDAEEQEAQPPDISVTEEISDKNKNSKK